MIGVIEDADKEFLRGDNSATIYLKAILQDGGQKSSGLRALPERSREKAGISSTLQKIMNPACNIYIIIINSLVDLKSKPKFSQKNSKPEDNVIIQKQKQIAKKETGSPKMTPDKGVY